MFDFLRKTFGSNQTKLNTTIKQAANAANKYGTNASRSLALTRAKASDDAAKDAKTSLDLALANLKSQKDTCSLDISRAQAAVNKAQTAYNAVKDGVLRRAYRFARTGHWGSKENVTKLSQTNMQKKANSRAQELRTLATKQAEELKKREDEQKKRKETLDRILKVSNSAQSAVTAIPVPTNTPPPSLTPPQSQLLTKNLNNKNPNRNNGGSNLVIPTSSGGGRKRNKTHRR